MKASDVILSPKDEGSLFKARFFPASQMAGRAALRMTVSLAFFLSGILSSHAAEPVRVHVTVLHASTEGSDFDLDNDAYRDRLIELFSYTSYHQSNQFVLDLEEGGEAKSALPEGYELVLSHEGAENGRILVHALIHKKGERYVDTVLAILRPGVVFVGGPPVSKGALIIVLETHL